MFKTALMVLLCLGFAYELFKEMLAQKQKDKPMPENVADVYDAQEYQRWRSYTAEKNRIGMYARVVEFILLGALLWLDAFASVYKWAPGEEYGKSLVLLTAYLAVMAVAGLPFSYLRTFRVEEKYGFNRSKKKTFFLDKLKELILELVICLGLYSLAYALYGAMGNAFFVAFYGVVAAVMLCIIMFSLHLQKLFYKFTPLAEGELRTSLSGMFASEGYSLKEIYVKDASRRTAHANAFCTGLGKFKSISLDDNLVNQYTPGEITAVFAHELAHFKHRDTAKITLYSMLMMLVLTGIIASFAAVPQISVDCGFDGASLVFAVIVLMSSMINPIMTLLAIPQALLSRGFECRADTYAVKKGYGPELIAALKKLHGDSLCDLNPHPLVVWLEHTHPTLSQRIALVERVMSARDAQ